MAIWTPQRCPAPTESLRPERHYPAKDWSEADLDATPPSGFRNSRRVSATRIYNLIVAPLADETEHLRVLIANERKDRLALVAPIVAALGHEVIAREIEVEDVGPVTAR
jgi:hypothetical protein